MKCKAIRKEIEEIEAGAAVSVEAEAHLLLCASCRAFADERRTLRQLVGSLESISAPPDFDWRLRARLAEARTERDDSRGWLFGFTLRAQTFALAAAFVFLFVAVVIYQQTRPLPQGGAQSASVVPKAEKAGVKMVESPSVAVNQVPASRTEETAPVPKLKDPTRARVTKSVKASAARAESANPAAPQRIFSNDLGSRSAQEFTPVGLRNSFTDAGPVISVPVRSSKSAPLQFEDGQGTRRTLASVRFGGQELIERPEKARLVPASEKGIW